MSYIQSKRSMHTKRKEKKIHTQEKFQSIETDLKLTQMKELVDKDSDRSIISIFYMHRKVAVNMLNSETENIKKT